MEQFEKQKSENAKLQATFDRLKQELCIANEGPSLDSSTGVPLGDKELTERTADAKSHNKKLQNTLDTLLVDLSNAENFREHEGMTKDDQITGLFSLM